MSRNRSRNGRGRDQEREIDRRVRDDLRSRAGQNRSAGNSGGSVPLVRSEESQRPLTKINGQAMAQERGAFRRAVHRSGAGGCTPLMASVIKALHCPYEKIDHIVVPRSTGCMQLTTGLAPAINFCWRDSPRGLLLQHKWSVSLGVSSSGDFCFFGVACGQPWQSLTAAAYNQTTYTEAGGMTGATTLALNMTPFDGRPVPSGVFDEGAHCLGLKFTLTNMGKAISLQEGRIVAGQTLGDTLQGNNVAGSINRNYSTVYDAQTVVDNITLCVCPIGSPVRFASALTSTDLLGQCGFGNWFFVGTGLPAGTPLTFEIEAAYLYTGQSAPLSTDISYATPQWECGLMCSNREGSVITYEEPSGEEGSGSGDKAANAAIRTSQKTAAAKDTLSMPSWVVEAAQAALPAMKTVLGGLAKVLF